MVSVLFYRGPIQAAETEAVCLDNKDAADCCCTKYVLKVTGFLLHSCFWSCRPISPGRWCSNCTITALLDLLVPCRNRTPAGPLTGPLPEPNRTPTQCVLMCTDSRDFRAFKNLDFFVISFMCFSEVTSCVCVTFIKVLIRSASKN